MDSATPFEEAEESGSCGHCGAEAPLNGEELCEECKDEEQRELFANWAEGNA